GRATVTRRRLSTTDGTGRAPLAGARSSAATARHLPRAAPRSAGDVKTYLLEIRTGQEVMKGLLAFARKYKLVAGSLTGIGAISDAVIGYFDPAKNAYLRNHEKGQAEVLSLTGNLALYKDEPFFHVHVALGLRDGSARGDPSGVSHVDRETGAAPHLHVRGGGPADRGPRRGVHLPHVHGHVPEHRHPRRQRGLAVHRHARRRDRNADHLPQRAGADR